MVVRLFWLRGRKEIYICSCVVLRRVYIARLDKLWRSFSR